MEIENLSASTPAPGRKTKKGLGNTLPTGSEPRKLAYRVAEIPKISGIPLSTIYRLMASGDLPFTKILGRRFITHEALQSLLNHGAPLKKGA